MTSIFKHILSSSSSSSSSVMPSSTKSSSSTDKKSKLLNLRRKSEVVSTDSSKLLVSVLKKTDEENEKTSLPDTQDLTSSPSMRNRRHSVPEPTIHIEEASSLDTIHEVNSSKQFDIIKYLCRISIHLKACVIALD
jgi:hypothetical protein